MCGIKVGDTVKYKNNPYSFPCEVLEVKDLGHGKGNERVKIRLLGSLIRYYASKELEIVHQKGKGEILCGN